MKFKLLTLLIFLTVPVCVQAQKKKYVGYEYTGVVKGKTLPNGVKDLGGGLLSDENYGISRFSKGKNFMLWMGKITSRDSEGVPDWQVKDVLSFGKLKKNQEFLLSYSSNCRQNDKQNLDLVVMARFLSKSKTYTVVKAWRASIKREKFVEVSTKNIRCAYVESQ